MKKGLKIALWVVGILVAILLLVGILAGPIVKNYVNKHSVELCHRQAHVKHVRINVLTGKVALIGLDAKEENGKDRFIHFDKLKVRVSLPRLLGKTVRINKIQLNNLEGKVIQDGIRFNFSDIIDFYTKDRKHKPQKGPSKWKVDIRHIHVKNAAVLYKDVRVGSTFDTKNVDIKVPRLYLKGKPMHVNMTTDFRQGGSFALKGNYNIEKGDFDANVKMKQLSLAMGWPYLKELIKVGQLKGLLEGDASVKGCVKHIKDLQFAGNLGLKNFSAVQSDKEPLLAFKALNVDLEKGDLGKKEFKVNKLELADPVIYFDVYENGNTLSRLKGVEAKMDTTAVSKKEARKAAKKKKEAQKDTAAVRKTGVSIPIQYIVKNLVVSNGRLMYADHSVSPQEQKFEVSALNMKADQLSNGKQFPVTLSAKLGNSGELACNAKLDPLNLANAKAKISIKNLEIKEFTPYSLHYLAYPVEDGLFNFESNIDIVNNMLDSRNELDLYKPAFGKKDKSITPAAAKIPMKAAVYVITDRKGHAKMDLPVQGDISSPEFSFGKVIWKTFLNLVVKIAASPVDFIAKAMAGDETFKTMAFDPSGQKELNIEQTHQLNAIAEYLKEKPEMDLEVMMTTESKGKADQCYELVQQHLVKKGVPVGRIVRSTESKGKPSKDKIKVDFNLKFEEE
ncbi:MAG: DUF748 domain-containing protein [Bacteroidales bacterium]|nr:DUF748 domain-containing protein [Bacteroidales bacterium]